MASKGNEQKIVRHLETALNAAKVLEDMRSSKCDDLDLYTIRVALEDRISNQLEEVKKVLY